MGRVRVVVAIEADVSGEPPAWMDYHAEAIEEAATGMVESVEGWKNPRFKVTIGAIVAEHGAPVTP